MQPPQSVSISTATFIKAVLIVLGLWFLWFIRDIVAIFVASILLAALIEPFASWFAARSIPRGLAVLIVYTCLLSLAAVFIVLVLSFYMVVDEERMRKYFRSLAPIEYQPYVAHLMKKMSRKMGEWLRGQIILGLIVGVAVYVGLTFLGVKYALVLALIAGLLEVIPYVGPIISLVPAGIIGFAQSPFVGLAVVILYLVIQQLENNVLVPKIMQKVTGLNPIISILALLVGLKAGGLAGAVLAIPLAMMGGVILED